MTELVKQSGVQQEISDILGKYVSGLNSSIVSLISEEQGAEASAKKGTARSAFLGFVIGLLAVVVATIADVLPDFNFDLLKKGVAGVVAILGFYLTWTNTKQKPEDSIKLANSCGDLAKNALRTMNDIKIELAKDLDKDELIEVRDIFRDQVDELESKRINEGISTSIARSISQASTEIDETAITTTIRSYFSTNPKE